MVKGRRIEKATRVHILPQLSGYAVRRGILFLNPLRYLLRGFCFENSGFDAQKFTVWAFVQPLFVPDDAIILSVGGRLGTLVGQQNAWWTMTEENESEVMSDILKRIKREGHIIFDRYGSLKLLAENAVHVNAHSAYYPEMAAYAYLLLGDSRRSAKMFARVEELLANPADRRPYEDEILARTCHVRSLYKQAPADAVAQLNEWRLETARNLRLTEFLGSTVGAVH